MKLALFFTLNVSLKLWDDQGLLDREKQLYEQHLKRGTFNKIYWITYGYGDRDFGEELKRKGKLLKDIEILPMKWNLKSKFNLIIYSFFLPFIYRKVFRKSDLLKTNQMMGSWSAVLCKWFYKKPLIIRTGFTKSLFAQRQNKSKLEIFLYRCIERFVYRNCDAGIVASKKDREFILNKYSLDPDKIHIVRNYIDTDIFYPYAKDRYNNRILYVGRLTKQKNLYNCIEAVARYGFTLDIYGNGELFESLKEHSDNFKANVNFMGVAPNNDLCNIYNRYSYFILPSLYEGLPKALLEAMACGLICIGTDVDGINEVIKDEVNGFLAKGTGVDEIYHALKKAINSNKKSIHENAIKTIADFYSLSKIIKQDLKIISNL